MKYSILTLSGPYRETGPLVPSPVFSRRGAQFRFDHFLIRIEKLLSIRRIRKVLIVCKRDFQPGLIGGAEAVCEQLIRLSGAGKETFFYAAEYGPVQLYLASACAVRMIHPLGSFSFLGLSRSFLFFRNAADKMGIDSTVIRRGRYKSAGDRFRTDHLDPWTRRQYGEYFGEVQMQLKKQILAGTGKEESDLQELLDGRVLQAEEAKNEGWVDQIKTAAQLQREWKKEKARPHTIKNPGKSFGRGRKKIAVLVFEGLIIDGTSKRDPLLGQAVGSDSFIRHIHKLTDDSAVKGVVLRVNSGGGSATASEDILSALLELGNKKPLVVSMSGLAASGGYWISCCAERLFAPAACLTGSIGVITLSFAVGKFLERYGITTETLKTGPYADFGSALRPLDEKERHILERSVETLYEKFLTKVSGFRGIEKRDLEKLAGGRVWSGVSAVQNHLADEIGGLSRALDYLRTKTEFKNAKIVFYPRTKPSLLERVIRSSVEVSGIFNEKAGFHNLRYFDGAIKPVEGLMKEGLSGQPVFDSRVPLVLLPETGIGD